MPECNVIRGMDRAGITVLEDAFDAKPMYYNIRRSDQPFARFPRPRRCWALRPSLHSSHARMFRGATYRAT